MQEPEGRRERNRREMRKRVADAAARLFTERGYDAVAMSDVARAAGVADQTVYNYFPTKPSLVLDRADDMRERSRRAVSERDPSLTPADALRSQIHEDIDHFASRDVDFARGEFPAQSVGSDSFRRFALEFRHDQAEAIATAIAETDPDVHPLLARTHAHALVTVVQTITDRIGSAILSGSSPLTVARELHAEVDVALDDASDHFRMITARTTGGDRHPSLLEVRKHHG